MSFSAGSVTSGARTQHNFSTTRVRTTCLCHVPRSSSSSVPNTPVSLTHARRRISSKRHDHIRQLRVASSVPSGRDGGRSDARTRSRKLQTQRLRRQLPRRRKPRKGEGRGVAASSDALDDHITSAIARLTLQSRSNTECGPTDSAITTTMREAGVRYHNEVQAADSTRREQSGPPHVHVFGAMITSLVSQITQITPQPTFIDQLGQISRWLNAATLTAVMESGNRGTLVTNPSAQPDTCTNPSEQRDTRRGHQSSTLHCASPPLVRDGPAGTSRAGIVDTPVPSSGTDVTPTALAAETRLLMKRGDTATGSRQKTGPLAQILRFQSERRTASIETVTTVLPVELVSDREITARLSHTVPGTSACNRWVLVMLTQLPPSFLTLSGAHLCPMLCSLDPHL